MSGKSSPGKNRRWIRRIFLVMLVLPFLLWAALSLLLTTSWGTGFISRKIEKKLGLACEIGQVGWTPWSGIFFEKMVLSAPEDFSPTCDVVHVASVKISPRWRQIFQKQLVLKEFTVDGVKVNMPVELLKHLTKKNQGPPLVLTEPSSAPTAPQQAPRRAVPAQEKAPKKTEAPVPQEVVPVPVKADGFVSQVSLQNISLKLYSLQQPQLEFSVSGVSADFPVGGPLASGVIKMAHVSAGGGELFQNLSLPLNWTGASLELPEQVLEVRGFEFALSAALSPVSGFPYGIRVNAPEQAVSVAEVLQMDIPITVEKFAARGQLNGYLTHPRLFSGSSISTYRDVAVKDSPDQAPVVFDWGQVQFQLTPAGLVSPDFRWVGEEEAILGNGYITTSGDFLAVTRLVTSAERAQVYENRAREFREGFSLRMRPLETPDRWYSDIRFELGETGVTVSLEEDESSPKILP